MGSAAEHAIESPGDPRWADVGLATRLLAIDPAGLGGIVLRGGAGPSRDRVCAWVREQQPAGAPLQKIPLHVTEDRLLGGISLADTLRSGRLVREQGLLARCDGGIAVVAMAERLEPHVVSHLCAVVDRGELVLEREGISAIVRCRLGLVVLDEGLGDERTPTALRDRLAFEVELDGLDPRVAPELEISPRELARARARLRAVSLDDEAVDALCRAAGALGIASLRAVVLAATAARAHAAANGRDRVGELDLQVAARLVLGPRAERLEPPSVSPTDEEEPAANDSREPEPPPEAEPPPEPQLETTEHDDTNDASEPPPPADDTSGPLGEIVLEAAKSGIPGGVLEALRLGTALRHAPRRAGQAGVAKASMLGGRPTGTLAAPPAHGSRLHVLDTLRAAAPWQRLRGRELGSAARARLEIRKEDFRVRRFAQRTETCVIFAVDASGSAAQQRLAEAKGAVERVLADCYVRRDHVALIAFRGTEATLVLPPTRSLARVRRRLAALPGGGTTPLAAGIDAALALADASRRGGRTPLVVFMTDGRGNVARDGRGGAGPAREDALASSRRLRVAGVPTLMLDTAARSRPDVRRLAAEMNARYLALPRLDTAGVSREIQALAKESTCR